tara:strand:- start:297 stop:1457 length:1161 start_codon:yes stop_codon:yes gene_type:complete
MLGSPIPVQLPYDASEDRLIVRRQNKLARDIDIIQQKIRNNVYSAAEGNQKIQFKRAEIAQLQKYRGSKRLDTGRLSPAPKTRGLFSKKKKTTKPASKYNPYAEDKVGKGTEPTGMFSMDQVRYNRANPEARSTAWAEDDRAGMTSQSNQRSSGSKPPAPNDRSALNQRGYSPANYYSRYVENYQRRNISKNSWDTGLRKTIPINMKKAFESDAERAWRANRPLPNLVPHKGDKPTIDKAKKTVKDNPHSFDYGTSYSIVERGHSFNAAKKYKGRYYGPKYRKNKFGLKLSSRTNKKKWDGWNKANNIAGFAGMPNHLVAQRARANRETALMRKRMGARLNLDNPNMNMTNRSQDSPRQVTRPQESVSNLAGGLTKTRNSMQRLLK